MTVLVVAASAAAWGAALRFGGALSPVDPIAHFLLALALVVLACHGLGAVLGRLGQPPVLGEMIGGLALGPSVLGWCLPRARSWLFPPETVGGLAMVAQLGLITFVFLLGCDLDLSRLHGRRLAVGSVTLGGIGLPFAGGAALALPAWGLLAGPQARPVGYVLFIGLAVSITALPVLAKILEDLGMGGTDVGVVAMTSAVIGDAVAWGMLSLILAAERAGSGGPALATTVGLAAALVALTAVSVRPALAWLVERAERGPAAGPLLLPVLVAGMAGSATLTQLVGLHPVIGAFLFGVAVPRHSPAIARVGRQLRAFTVTVLLPVFFAGVGLSASVGLIGASADHWLLLGTVLAVASLTKFVGAAGGARLAGMPTPAALRVGALMNCRGVTEVTVAMMGLQYGVISTLGFTILVLVAIVTTGVTHPTVRLLARREAAVAQ